LKINEEIKNLIPKLQDEEFKLLEKSILSDGCRDALIVWNDILIDGHNRFNICEKHNIEYKTIEKHFESIEEAKDWIIVNQLSRRNLTKEQRQYLIGLRYRNEKKKIGENQYTNRGSQNGTSKTYNKIADEENVSKNTVIRAEKFANAIDELAETCGNEIKDKILNREFKASQKDVQKLISFETQEQKEIIKEVIDNNISLNDVLKKEKVKAQRNKRVEKLDKPHSVFKVNKKYNIIYVDPPWKYPAPKEFYGQDVQFHYNTMSLSELKDLPVKEISKEDCVLYMWATAPLLDVAIDLLKTWGFQYKSCLVWDKVKHNMGFYSSVRHEILLIGGRGQSAPTDKKYANQTDSVYSEPRQEHSKKPLFYYEMIEKMHPCKTEKIELFARQKKEGWDSWGDEVAS
jgi:N6-adenosine-specific RNA methylase IME4